MVYKDGSDAWEIGALGFFLKRRGQLALLTSGILVTLAFQFYDPAHTPVVAAVFVVLLGLLLYLRGRIIRSLKIKKLLHLISHAVRDSNRDLLRQVSSETEQKEIDLIEHLDHIVIVIQKYLHELIDDSVELAIRLAVLNDSDRLVFQTVSRSPGMEHRSQSSQATPARKGIPAYLSTKSGSRGVAI